MDKFDVIVIGAGPAGYVAAIKCAQLGAKTLCIEKWQNDVKQQSLGGTCLNVGCIPSKALLEVSHRYEFAREHFEGEGIRVKSLTADIPVMMRRKDGIVKKLTGGIAALFKANGISSVYGHGKLLKDKCVEVTPVAGGKTNGGKKVYRGEHIILASGSVPMPLPGVPFDNKVVTDSTGALSFTKPPKNLCIIGAGIIGLELGSVWGRLGSQVTLLEALPDFLPMTDRQIAKDALRHFKKDQKLDIKLNSKVTGIKTDAKKQIAEVAYEEDGKKMLLKADKVVVAIGRKPYTEELLSADCGIAPDARGFIPVDEYCRTSVQGVYAVGDLVRGPMLAHKGSEEGIMVAEIIHNKKAEVNYDLVPNVIYTSPEIAWVGLNEEEAKAAGKDFKTGVFPFAASGRAMANNDTRGMVKILADKESDSIIGVHVIGNQAGELIAQAVIAMEFMASAEDLQLTMFAHPTLSEAVHEASLAADGRPIHIMPPRRSQ